MFKKIVFAITIIMAAVISVYLNRYHQFSVYSEFLIIAVSVLTWLLVCVFIDSIRKY